MVLSPLLKLEAAKRDYARRKKVITRTQVEPYLKILDKDNNLIPFRLNRAQEHLKPRLTGRDLLLKARQLGLSTFIRAEHETMAMTQTCRLATLAHDQDTTDMLRRMSRRFWENIPDHLRPSRGTDNASTTIYANTNSEVVIKTAGSKAGGRGGTVTSVHGSEVAFWNDASENMASIMQAVPINGTIVLESTPNGAQGWFYEECMKALEGDSIWTLHFYQWWWADEYQLPLEHGETLDYTEEEAELAHRHNLTPQQIKWRRYKMKEIPHKFKQEYPEDIHECFLTSGNSYFGDVEQVFNAPLNAVYNPEHRYVAGLDFAQDNDYTVLKIIDATVYEQVASLRMNQMRWDDMRNRIKQELDKWGSPLVLAEANSMGSTNIEALDKEGANIRAFRTTAKSKPMLIQTLYAGLHENGLQLQDEPNTKHEFRNFISKQTTSGNWQYEANAGAHDDEVIATALAWYGVVRGRIEIEAV